MLAKAFAAQRQADPAIAELELRLGVLRVELRRPRQLRDRRVRLPLGREGLGEHHPYLGHRGVLIAQRSEVLNREGGLALGQVLEGLGRLHLDREPLGVGIVLGHGGGDARVAHGVARAIQGHLDPRGFLVGVDGPRRRLDHLPQHRLRLGRAPGTPQHAGEADGGGGELRLLGQGLAVRRLGRGQVALGLLGVAERRRRGSAAPRRPRLLREIHRFVGLALVGPEPGKGDGGPDAGGIGGGRGLGAGRGLGHAPRVLQDGQPPEGLALGGAPELVRGRAVGVDGEVHVVLGLQGTAEPQRRLPRGGLRALGLPEQVDRAVQVAGRALLVGLLQQVRGDGRDRLLLVLLLALLLGAGGEGQEQGEHEDPSGHGTPPGPHRGTTVSLA